MDKTKTREDPDRFYAWLARHKTRFPHREWAKYELGLGIASPVYRGWLVAFRTRGIGVALAERASVRLQARRPAWPEDHLEAILDECAAIRAEEATARDARARDRARAADEAARARRAELETWLAALPDRTRADIERQARAEAGPLADFPAIVHLYSLELLAVRQPLQKTRPQPFQASA